jgi:AcrR family transcriptional regulator
MSEDGEHGRPIAPPAERRRRQREEVVAAILAAARAVMRERGVAGLSLHEVARRVGMRAPSLYGYFPSKSALYDVLYRQGLVEIRSSLEGLAYGRPFWEGIRGAFGAYFAFAARSPELYQLVFERPVPGFVPSEESMAAGLALLSELHAIVGTAIEQGEITPDLSVTSVSDLLITVLHGLTSQQLANEPGVPFETGRYGALAPAVIELLRAAWSAK